MLLRGPEASIWRTSLPSEPEIASCKPVWLEYQPETLRQVVLAGPVPPLIKQSKTDIKRAHQAADNILDRR